MHHEAHGDHCHPQKNRPDYLLWGSLLVILMAFVHYLFFPNIASRISEVPGVSKSMEVMLQAPLLNGSETIVNLMQKMAWGLIFALLFVGLLDFVPKEKFHQLLGRQKGQGGIVRAVLAGVLLDLCSHGILLVGMKLYERGASIGQVVAFLVASPWNSFSMTLILWSLVGWKMTLGFISLSCVIALISGHVFDALVKRGVLSSNPNQVSRPETSKKIPWFVFPKTSGPLNFLKILLGNSLSESKMILRWIFFGVVLTAVVKELISPEGFKAFFGPDFTGILLTVVAATILEVCSEGSAPLASELVTTANAPGNGFTFLMAGVSTDYTEIAALKETTGSWKMAFFLPLVTLPQIILLGVLMNIGLQP